MIVMDVKHKSKGKKYFLLRRIKYLTNSDSTIASKLFKKNPAYFSPYLYFPLFFSIFIFSSIFLHIYIFLYFSPALLLFFSHNAGFFCKLPGFLNSRKVNLMFSNIYWVWRIFLFLFLDLLICYYGFFPEFLPGLEHQLLYFFLLQLGSDFIIFASNGR